MNIILIIYLLLSTFLISCSNNNLDEPNPPMTTITFNNNIVASNSMTRSDNNEFLNIIKKQTPNYIYVSLKNIDLNKTYTCKSNEPITIPIGNYEISAESGTPNFKHVVGTTGNIYETPLIKCDKFNINITDKTQIINLNSYYNCYAVFALIDECKNCYATYIDKNVTFYKIDKYYVGYFDFDGMKFNIIPYDDSTEFISTTYIFSTTYEIGNVFAEYGKYYIIHPQKVNKTNTSFNLYIPDMTQGNI